MIYISKSFLPPIKEYEKYLKKIWKSHILTSQDGELVTSLENKLKKYWGVKHVVCVSNGTTAIQLALKALDVKEVYTSPFSFIATVAAPRWLGIKVKFVDMNKDYPKNKPVLSTHVYGIPEKVHGSPLIYDASHAFTTKVDGKSVMGWGDVSIISFSAVKIFQCGEGGAVVTNNKKLADKVRIMRNYGIIDRYKMSPLGTNGKMSELHAAMGLSVLPYIGKIRRKLDNIIKRYNKAFGADLPLGCLLYYPVILSSDKIVRKVINEFEKSGIFPRRYFYPPLNLVYGGKRCPYAEDYMSKVLAIPLHYYLTKKDIDKVISIIKKYL